MTSKRVKQNYSIIGAGDTARGLRDGADVLQHPGGAGSGWRKRGTSL